MSNKLGDKTHPLNTRVDGKPIIDIVINSYSARNLLIHQFMDVEKVTFDVEVMLQSLPK